MDDRNDAISQRAYQLWQEEGHPHGRDAEHWEQATRDIDEARHQTAQERRDEPAPSVSAGRVTKDEAAATPKAARKADADAPKKPRTTKPAADTPAKPRGRKSR